MVMLGIPFSVSMALISSSLNCLVIVSIFFMEPLLRSRISIKEIPCRSRTKTGYAFLRGQSAQSVSAASSAQTSPSLHSCIHRQNDNLSVTKRGSPESPYNLICDCLYFVILNDDFDFNLKKRSH